ncbi:MAG: double-strand break repair protein AddB [Sphingomonadaceae bacterium]
MSASEARGRLFVMPPWRPFVDDLAAGLIARHPDPLELARVRVILPGRRAVRALTEAFVRQTETRALLLPRLSTVGDLDEGPGGDPARLLDDLELEAPLPPAIDPLSRRLVLARLLARSGDRRPAEALALGGELAGVLDTLAAHGLTAAAIAEAVAAADLQGHWQANARVLALLVDEWPAMLAPRGCIDPAERLEQLLAALARRWAASPPETPVVMAGFAQAPPAVARLAGVVAGLPGGLVVLSGLEADRQDNDWAAIRDTIDIHPQHGLARLLEQAGLSPGEAELWPWESDRAGSPVARAATVRSALEAAALMPEGWRPDVGALPGVRMVEARGPAEEALLIAIALRQVVERAGATAALVTTDRALAQRVAVQLKRFGIEIDDSAGVALSQTRPGGLLVALAAAAGQAFAPVPLLALLQHPLVEAGEGRLDWLGRLRLLDRLALRGLRPEPGLEGVARRLAGQTGLRGLADWWAADVQPRLGRLARLPGNGRDLMRALVETAVALAGEGLWAGEAGRALAALVEQLDEAGADLAEIRVAPADAAAFVAGLLATVTVRPRWARHPQLAIWGPLEARLQAPDLMVLGGLNEGSWPVLPAPDPFLAPAIRRALGLPGLARRIGFQAHDLQMALGAREVLMTRAVRADGAPTVPSRFWQRLQAASGGELADAGDLTPPAGVLLGAARRLDRPAQAIRIERPAPSPPAAIRPRTLRVTEVAKLKADPYSFYAERILGLSRLDARDALPTALDRGTAVHAIVEAAVREPEAELATLVDRTLEGLGERPELRALWRPRLLRMAGFVRGLMADEQEWTPILLEKRGEIAVLGVTLRGQPDRIDQGENGLRIIDYKTGEPPKIRDVLSLAQPQLALLAGMAARGAFEGLPDRPVVALDYVKLSGGREEGKVRAALGDRTPTELTQHLEAAWADLETLIRGYLLGDRSFDAKQDPVFGRRYADHDLVARVAEWLGRA